MRAVLTVLSRLLRALFASSQQSSSPPSSGARQRPGVRKPSAPPTNAGRGRSDRRTGDRLVLEYQPDLNGDPDPGEIVWTWVPYEDDPARGKDRPVLLVGRVGDDLAGLMLTSKDHDRDAADEARWGRVWMDIGAGDWDAKRRPSEVRLDRLLRVDPAGVRREGSVVDRALFDRVVAAMVKTRGNQANW